MNQLYYKELSKYSSLSDEQLCNESRNYQQGDLKALNNIVEANLKLVVLIANKYSSILKANDVFDVDDLICEGNIGLIQASQKFNPDAGVKFTYFATLCIKQQIIEFINNKVSTIRVPYRKARKFAMIQKKVDELVNELQVEVTHEDLLQTNAFNESDIEQFFSRTEYIRMNEEYEIPSPEIEEDERIDNIRLLLEHLSPREKKIIVEYFGIDCDRKTLTQIGKEIGVSKSGLCQIKNRALKNVKKLI